MKLLPEMNASYTWTMTYVNSFPFCVLCGLILWFLDVFSGRNGPLRGRACSADFQVCCIAGFQARWQSGKSSSADLEIGDTAGLETCATRRRIPLKTSRKRFFLVAVFRAPILRRDFAT
jgi:hypothetical protein